MSDRFVKREEAKTAEFQQKIGIVLTDCTCGTFSGFSNLNYITIEIVLQNNCIKLVLYYNLNPAKSPLSLFK